jgi:hypothetical protein
LGLFLGRLQAAGGGGGTRIEVFLRRYRAQVCAIYILATLAVLFFGPSQKWQVALPVLFAIPITGYANQRDFLSPVIPSEQLRPLCIFLLAILPFYAFGRGSQAAEAVLAGSKFDYVLSPIDGVPTTTKVDLTTSPRFVGHAGDFLFFWEPEKSLLVISKFEDGKSLVLGRFERTAPASQTH